MRLFQFVLKARESGLSERQIADLIERRHRDRLCGRKRPWEAYLPGRKVRPPPA